MKIPMEQLLAHLDQVARSTAAAVDPNEATDGGAALLFTGSPHVLVPELLLRQVVEQQLDPNAAIMWQLLRSAITGSSPVFQRLHAFTQRQIHCSKPKAVEITALLRATRWLTLRDKGDREQHAPHGAGAGGDFRVGRRAGYPREQSKAPHPVPVQLAASC